MTAEILKRKSFWAAILLAATIILAAAGVKIPAAVTAAIQAAIQAIPDGEQPSPPAPLPPDGRGEASDASRGEGPDNESEHHRERGDHDPATTPSSDGVSTGPVGNSEARALPLAALTSPASFAGDDE